MSLRRTALLSRSTYQPKPQPVRAGRSCRASGRGVHQQAHLRSWGQRSLRCLRRCWRPDRAACMKRVCSYLATFHAATAKPSPPQRPLQATNADQQRSSAFPRREYENVRLPLSSIDILLMADGGESPDWLLQRRLGIERQDEHQVIADVGSLQTVDASRSAYSSTSVEPFCAGNRRLRRRSCAVDRIQSGSRDRAHRSAL